MVQSKQRKRDMRFCTWIVSNLYRSGLLTTVARELESYKLDLVGVGQRGHSNSRGLHFLLRKGKENHELRTGFFVHQRVASTVKRVEFVSDRMLHILLRGCWYNIIILNVHAPSEEKIDDLNNSFMRN